MTCTNGGASDQATATTNTLTSPLLSVNSQRAATPSCTRTVSTMSKGRRGSTRGFHSPSKNHCALREVGVVAAMVCCASKHPSTTRVGGVLAVQGGCVCVLCAYHVCMIYMVDRSNSTPSTQPPPQGGGVTHYLTVVNKPCVCAACG